MEHDRHAVLVEIVERHEQSGNPVPPAAVAESMNVSEDALLASLEPLCEFEFLENTGQRYRPTVTAHELLAMEVAVEDVLVVDVVDG